MPKPLSIQAHLTLQELETGYRRANDPVARSHWQVVWLLAQGLPSAQVAAVTGYTVNWIRLVARRYNQQGPAGLDDRRHRNSGAGRLLSAAQRTALAAALTQPPPDGGVWTGPKAAAWMAAPLDRQSAAPAPCQGGSDRPSGLQKTLPAVVHALQQAYPQQEVELWATDQHRIGLKPIRRRVWSPRGQRPGALVQHRYQWCYLYAFVHPGSGRTWWL